MGHSWLISDNGRHGSIGADRSDRNLKIQDQHQINISNITEGYRSKGEKGDGADASCSTMRSIGRRTEMLQPDLAREIWATDLLKEGYIAVLPFEPFRYPNIIARTHFQTQSCKPRSLYSSNPPYSRRLSRGMSHFASSIHSLDMVYSSTDTAIG